MENDGAMRVDNALGKTRRAGSKAHGRALIFVDRRQVVIRRSAGKQFFVVQKTTWNFVAAIRNDNDFFERRICAKFFQDGEKRVIDDEKTVFRVPRDRRNFVRMQPQIERVKNSAGARHAEKRLQMSAVIPHHRSDAIAAPQAELRQRRCKLACPASKIAVSGPNDGAVRFAGNDFNLREKFAVALKYMLQRQRKIHHRSAHTFLGGPPSSGSKLSAS